MKRHAKCCGYTSFAGLKGIKSSCLAHTHKRIFYNLILRYFSGFSSCSSQFMLHKYRMFYEYVALGRCLCAFAHAHPCGCTLCPGIIFSFSFSIWGIYAHLLKSRCPPLESLPDYVPVEPRAPKSSSSYPGCGRKACSHPALLFTSNQYVHAEESNQIHIRRRVQGIIRNLKPSKDYNWLPLPTSTAL